MPCIGGGIPGVGPRGGICAERWCCAPGIGGNCSAVPTPFVDRCCRPQYPHHRFSTRFNKSIGVSNFCSLLVDGMSTSSSALRAFCAFSNSKSSIAPPVLPSSRFLPSLLLLLSFRSSVGPVARVVFSFFREDPASVTSTSSSPSSRKTRDGCRHYQALFIVGRFSFQHRLCYLFCGL